VSATPIFDHAGRMVAAVLVFPDITEHKLAVEALRGSEERFKRLLEHSNDLVVVLDEHGLQVSVSGQ